MRDFERPQAQNDQWLRRARSAPSLPLSRHSSLFAANRWLLTLLIVAALAATFVLVRGRAGSINSRLPESKKVLVPRSARTASSLAPAPAPVATSYTWNGLVNSNWTVAANWTPARALPDPTDVLVFNGSNVTVTNVPTQEIAELHLINGASITLNAETTVPAGAKTLTISGGAGADRLTVQSGNSLTLAGTTNLTISLASGSTGVVDGQVALLKAAHKLTAGDAGAIKFKSGSFFAAGSTTVGSTGFTGNPFGTGTDGSVVFQSGSDSFFSEGSDPFGGAGHSVATFNLGSSQTLYVSSAFSSDGRTYGNLTLDGSQSYSGSGANFLTIFNTLTIASGSTLTLSSSSGGDLNLLGDITINGTLSTNNRTVKFQGGGLFGGNTQNITNGGSFGAVIISKSVGSVKLGNTTTIGGALQLNGSVDVLDLNGKTLNLNGTFGGTNSSASSGFKGSLGSTLNIGGTGALGTLRFISGAQILTSLTVNRTSSGSVTLGTDLTIGNASTGSLTLTNGVVDVGSNTLSLAAFPSISRTNGYVIGNLNKTFGATGAFTFTVGTSNGYTPVVANVTAGTGNSLTVRAVEGAQPNISGDALLRYWVLSNSGAVTANLTFHYLAADVVGSELNYKFLKYDGSFTQLNPDTVDTGSHFATINGVSSFSDWTLADPETVFGTLRIENAPYADSETNADHDVTITVSRTGGSNGPVDVNYDTSNGAASLADNDYLAASGTLHWNTGEMGNKTFTVTVKGDTTYEGDETVNLTLSAPTGGATLGSPATTTLTILNEDSQPAAFTVNTTNDVDDSACSASHCSLREAINIANVNPDASTIDFNIPGGDSGCTGGVCTITLTSALADLSTNITINGPTTAVTISGSNSNRVFSVALSAPVAISNLTIANGQAPFGGGIYNLGDLTITNCTFTGNKAVGASAEGGAIDTEAGTVRIINSTISGNSSEGIGGGLLNCGTSQTTLTNVTITKNQSNSAKLSDSAGGGGIGQISSNPITLNNTIVAGNHAWFRFDSGSFFTNDDDDLNCQIIPGSTVDPNSMNNLIGVDSGVVGISNGSNGNQIGTFDAPLSAQLGSLANNGGPTFTHALGDFSPAIDAGNNAVAVDQTNSALTTDQRGMGFPRIQNGTVDIGAFEKLFVPPPPSADVRVTKSANVSQSVVDRDITYTITVTNGGPDAAASLTLNDSQSQINPGDPSFTPQPGTLTFVSLSSPVDWSCTTPSAGTSGAVSCTKPSLAVSSDQVFTLVVHIPSGTANGTIFINTASVSSSTSDPTPGNNSAFAETTAFTCLANPIVTTNADSGAGSLRQAIADSCDGATITFDMGQVTSPITLTSAELAVSKNLTIQGPGANLLTVQRSAAGGTPDFRIFRINSGTTVTMSGLTITNGNVSGGNNGGGVLNSGILMLTNSTVSGNKVNTAAAGGGLFNELSATMILTNSTVSGNNAVNGGGMFNRGTLALTNSTVSGNTSGLDGGGLFTNSSASVTLTNSTVSGNTASNGNGGGIINTGGGTVNFANTIIANNISTNSPDLKGPFNSQDYNLIRNTLGATFTGATTHNIIGVDPLLGSLANNGGATQTRSLLPGSPAINAGSNANLPPDTFDLDGDADTTEPLPVDQRGVGFARVVNTTVDIGAFESRGFTISATSGTPQSATINTAFGSPLVATVSSAFSEPVAGGVVTFTAPASGASGTFTGGTATTTVTISGGGVATSPTFTANGIAGSYNVTAGGNGITSTATFSLTNTQAATTTTVTSSVNPSNSGQNVTFTATVTSTAGTPTGTVTFKDNGVAITGCSNRPLTSGQATCDTAALAPGNHPITADYSGDSNFATSTGSLAGGQVVKADVSVTVSPASMDEDDSGALVYTFTRNGSTANALTVNFSVGGTAIFTTDYTQTGATTFSSSSGSVTFDAGNSTATVTINPSTDTELESDETVILTVTSGTGYNVASPSAATGTITNDDTALQLLLDPAGPASNQAVAVDSILFMRDPFPIDRLEQWFNFPSADDNTRVMLFAYFQLLSGETANDVVVEVIDSASHIYNVTAEDVRSVNCPPCSQPMSQVTFRLPDMPAGTVTVRVKVHSLTSNAGTFRVTN